MLGNMEGRLGRRWWRSQRLGQGRSLSHGIFAAMRTQYQVYIQVSSRCIRLVQIPACKKHTGISIRTSLILMEIH